MFLGLCDLRVYGLGFVILESWVLGATLLGLHLLGQHIYIYIYKCIYAPHIDKHTVHKVFFF